MGGASEATETVSTPWGPQGRQLERFYGAAGERYDQAQQYFPGSTVGGRDRGSILAGEMVDGLGSKDYRQQAESYIGSVLGGDFMGGGEGNPHLDGLFDTMSSQVTEKFQRATAPGINSRFAGSGRSGSGAHGLSMGAAQGQLADSLGDVASRVYYGDYENRMDDRMGALGLTSGIQGLEYADIGQMRGQGAIEESYTQRQLDDSISRFNFTQQEPEARLDRFGSRVGKNLGFGNQMSTGSSSGGGASAGLGVLGLLTTLAGTAIGGPSGGVVAGLMGGGAGMFA